MRKSMSAIEVNGRFKGARYMRLATVLDVTLIGNGGIGSWLGVDLGRIGVKSIYNYEYDTVDDTNFGGQLFNITHKSQPKATALGNQLQTMACYTSLINLGKFTSESGILPIVFCCVDSNDVRQIIYDVWFADAEANGWEYDVEIVDEDGKKVIIKMPYLFVDGRMSFDNFDFYCVTRKDAINHRKYYIPDSSGIADDECSTKANPDVGKIVGALMQRVWKNKLDNVLNRNECLAEGIPEEEIIDMVATPWRLNGDLNFFKFPTYDTCEPPTTS